MSSDDYCWDEGSTRNSTSSTTYESYENQKFSRGGDRSERPARNWDSDRNDRPPRNWDSDRNDRPPRNWDSDRNDRPPRNWEGDRNDRPPKNWDGDRSNGFQNRGRRGSGFGDRGRGGGQNYRGKGNDWKTIIVPINSSDVGRIIGKGGSKIRELEEESGARIKVKDNSDSGEATVELRGSDEACVIAEQRIKDLTGPATYKETYRNNKQDEVVNDGPVDWGALIAAGFEARERKWAALPRINKEFYHEDPEVTHMTLAEVESFREINNCISVTHYNREDTRPIPNPVTHFYQAFQPYPEVLEEIYKQGFKNPSPIQAQGWPILLKGYDMIGIAQTGTGKTLAFLLPAMIHIDRQPVPREERVGPSCLILAPTRELAQQIERETKKYRYRNIKCVCIYGGGNRREQINTVTKGVEIVIATPGRLSDLMMNKFLDLGAVTYLVLDEADRMLDMGFEPQIKKILLDVRPDRQTVMTSATWPAGVRRLATQYMCNPFQVCVGSLDLAAVHSVTQQVIIIEDEEKRPKLYQFIGNMDPDDKVIIFCDKKIVADDLASDLILNGIQCQCIHGDREQCDREQALDDLASGLVHILVATDVASRGLDIKDITHILNYDFPRNVEEYVHRVGRTGRAGRTGKSLTFMTRGDWRNAQNLIDILEEAQQEVPQELVEMASRFRAWQQRKEAEEAEFLGPRRGGRGGGRGRGGSRRGGSRWNDGF